MIQRVFRLGEHGLVFFRLGHFGEFQIIEVILVQFFIAADQLIQVIALAQQPLRLGGVVP